MKKRIIALALLVCLTLTFAACQKHNAPNNPDIPKTGAPVTTEAPASTAEPTTTAAPATTTKPTTTAAPTTTTKPTTTAAPTTTTKPTTTAAPTTTTKPTTTAAPTTTKKPTTTAAPTTTTKAPEKVDLSALANRIIASAGVSGAMPLPKERLTDLYGIAQGDIASAGCFITMNGSFPEEAIMIEAKDGAAKGRITAALNTRLADVLVQAENYDAENYALAKQCKVISKGNYVALFVSPKHAAMESAFLGAVK